jgi:hypothetical protein
MHPLLGRRVHFDEKSRQYPVRKLLATKKPRSYTWKCPVWLDQGQTPACTGFSTAQKLVTRYPMIKSADNSLGMKLYGEAKKYDDWPGEDYDGSSVLGAMKAAAALGLIKSYHWGFSLDDAILALGYSGGGVAGINWYQDMFHPDTNGIIKPTGGLAGGHAILVNGVDLKRGLVRLHNSWGKDWAISGEAFMSIQDFGKLLAEDGEFVVPLRK